MCTLELKICFLGKKLYYLYTFTMFFAVMITFVYCQGNAIALLIRVFTLYNLKLARTKRTTIIFLQKAGPACFKYLFYGRL